MTFSHLHAVSQVERWAYFNMIQDSKNEQCHSGPGCHDWKAYLQGCPESKKFENPCPKGNMSWAVSTGPHQSFKIQTIQKQHNTNNHDRRQA